MAAPESTISRKVDAAVRKATVGVVTVTYNSDRFFDEYIAALNAQTYSADLVVIVDSGSTQPEFLERAGAYSMPVEILREKNVGVCVGNNIGWRRVRGFDYILFLNPDAFPAPDFIEKAVAFMEGEARIGMVTPSLLRYDIETHQPMDVIDTTGVVRNWYGFFEERDQTKSAESLKHYTRPNKIPWLCTAVAMGRREAMDAVVEGGDQLFDESFFMYKDDTDVSWRVRRAGWDIVHHPGLLGYHCRGWQNRTTVSRNARLLSARNEVKMCFKNHSLFLVVGLLKYVLVRWLDV
ncbi:glycosyltransferase family 2 protein [Tunturiibacter gelidiferens]|uniref:glycosyltransferase family 2 protein n=1 Tax=Tunturiibacter gelidiferens TaxID=3069689 RepID=UPI003D9B1802